MNYPLKKNISVFCYIQLSFYGDQSPSSCLWNTAWCYLYHWDNITQTMSSSWFPPDRGLNSINYFSHSLRVFFCLFVLQIPSLNLWLMECCRDGCPSFFHLLTWSLELNQWMSGSWSWLPWLFCLARMAYPMNNSAYSKLLQCQIYGGHCAFGKLPMPQKML